MIEAMLAATVDLPEMIFPDGAAVIVEDTSPVPLLVLVSGAVELSRQGVTVSTSHEPGAIFGEIAALLNTPATVTVRAHGECVFRRCDDPEGFLRVHPELAIVVSQLLARRLDALTRYLVDVRTQYSDSTDHVSVVDVVLESLSHHQGARPDPGSDREREAPY